MDLDSGEYLAMPIRFFKMTSRSDPEYVSHDLHDHFLKDY